MATLTGNQPNNGCWRTPPVVFEPLNDIFEFNLDAAAEAHNALCMEFFGPDVNALKQPWHLLDYPDPNTDTPRITPGRVWCNPPYSWKTASPYPKSEIMDWVRKGWQEQGTNAEVVVILLLMSRAQWFWEAKNWGYKFYLAEKRISFLGGTSKAPPGDNLLLVKDSYSSFTDSHHSTSIFDDDLADIGWHRMRIGG